MKLFPLKPMSQLDKMYNLIRVIEASDYINAAYSQSNRSVATFGVETQHYVQNGQLNKSVGKYHGNISQLVQAIRKVYNEKIARY